MLYIINKEYYIRTAPLMYTKVRFILNNGDVDIVPTKDKIEVNSNTIIENVNFQNEKDKIKEQLLKTISRNSRR